MEDEGIHNRIEQLVGEEHELYTRGAEGGLSDSERRRLDSIKVGLDQCWDLLASAGPSRGGLRPECGARPRSPRSVERYEQ
jgi:Protein of unknown function (DUF2630).